VPDFRLEKVELVLAIALLQTKQKPKKKILRKLKESTKKICAILSLK
jgi:hypothetical protein